MARTGKLHTDEFGNTYYKFDKKIDPDETESESEENVMEEAATTLESMKDERPTRATKRPPSYNEAHLSKTARNTASKKHSFKNPAAKRKSNNPPAAAAASEQKKPKLAPRAIERAIKKKATIIRKRQERKAAKAEKRELEKQQPKTGNKLLDKKPSLNLFLQSASAPEIIDWMWKEHKVNPFPKEVVGKVEKLAEKKIRKASEWREVLVVHYVARNEYIMKKELLMYRDELKGAELYDAIETAITEWKAAQNEEQERRRQEKERRRQEKELRRRQERECA